MSEVNPEPATLTRPLRRGWESSEAESEGDRRLGGSPHGHRDDVEVPRALRDRESSAARRRTVARLRLQIAAGAYLMPVDDLVARLLPVVLGPSEGSTDPEGVQSPPFVYWPSQ